MWILFLLALPLCGQVKYLTTEAGVWKPWKFTAIASARSERGATAAEVKAFEAQLLALNEIVKRTPGVAQPVGFSVETWGNLNAYTAPAPGQPAGKAVPLAGGFTFGAFPIFEYTRNGKVIREDKGETQLLIFEVNELQPWLLMETKPVDWGQVDTDAFVQPPAMETVAGFERHGKIFVLKKRPQSIYAPLPLEAALGLVRQARQAQVENRKEVSAKMAKSYQDWVNPAKRAERRKGYETVAAMQKDAAKYLAEMDQFEKTHEADLAKEVAPGGTQERELRSAEAAVAEVDAVLAGYTAAERMGPSCFADKGEGVRERFRPGTAAGCAPLARPNWGFFDAKLPRSAPQVVILFSFARCVDNPGKETNPSGCAANRKLVEALDREAVLEWLR